MPRDAGGAPDRRSRIARNDILSLTDDGTSSGEPAPSLRGVSHQIAFFAAVPVGIVLALSADGGLARGAAIAFAASVAAMFGVSGLFHRLRCTPAVRHRLGRLDHTMIYALISGTFAPIGLLAIDPAWRVPVLATAWGGALVVVAVKLAWRDVPRWLTPATCVALGWIAVAIIPQLFDRIGAAGAVLLLVGGVAYTAGAAVYAARRPDPLPLAFGYHEIFHALVIVAVACQYVTVAFFVLPQA